MKWFRRSEPEPLGVTMSGVKLGDRLLMIGGSDPRLLSGVAAKTGLTGRACVVDDSSERTAAAVAEAERQGALVEGFTAQCAALPFSDGDFDVVIIRAVLPALSPALRIACVSEVRRVLRPGGRALVIDGTERSGLSAVLSRQSAGDEGDAVRTLETAGFRAVRTLAEREGLLFVEGAKAAR